MEKIEHLTTEKTNSVSLNIDCLPTMDVIKIINDEDKKVATAVERELAHIAAAVDDMAERFMKGGRIIYCGAGTSGRLGTLDAVELEPTYSVTSEQTFGIIAGGDTAMYKAVEGAEDSKELGTADVKKVNLTAADVLIGIAASGRTPYTIAALEYGNSVGALTISVTCNPDSEMSKVAKHSIAPVVGAEVVTGSTRMKAGSAQKMVLNMLSTATMIKAGKVYGNQMINVQVTNKKLAERAVNIVKSITGLSRDAAQQLLERAENSIHIAIILHKTGVEISVAKDALAASRGNVSKAIELITQKS